MDFRLTRHAQEEMARRRIPEILVRQVLNQPEQIVPAASGRNAYQSRLNFPDGRTYLVRVVVAEIAGSSFVITVYRTSKVAKYWRVP
jgi:hypothetical protein